MNPGVKTHHSKWEKLLPKKFIIVAAEENPTLLKLKVNIETTDTAEKRSVTSLIDCGATGELIDQHYAKCNCFNLVKLSQPNPMYNIDSTPNEAGSIMEVLNLILHYKNHSERTTFAVSGLGKQKLILGHLWLQKHNPKINWITRGVKMSRCPPQCCLGCRDKFCEQHTAQKAENRWKNTCTAGPIPEIDHDSNSSDQGNSDVPLESLEEGDHILAAGLLPLPSPADIRASSTISQQLAKAFKANSEAESPLILEYLKEFTSVFSKKAFDVLPEPKEWDHAIEMIPESKALNCRVYLLSPSEQKELDKFLKENLETGWIWPSKSPRASPVFFIKKKYGLLQLVQDYWVLNATMVKNKYPLPLISKLINKLQEAKCFTKLNVRWGFNNVHMKKGDKWKADFWTHCRLYEPLVMFFGLINSLATFQTMMDDIFEGVVVVYLDNILILTKTLEEHWEVICKVLDLLWLHNLSLKPEKCEFEKTSIEYNGVLISQDSIVMDPAKVARVSEWPTPTTKKEVRLFPGFVNFYRRFIEGFSHISRPLFSLTKDDSNFQWSSDKQSAFDSLKEKVTSAPILALPNNLKPFHIEANSLDFATRAVLSQQNPDDDKWHLVAFLSKSLSPVERNYEIHDKETVMTSNNYQILACTHVWYWASYQLSTVIYLVLGSIWALQECHLLVVLSKRFESEVLQ